jgi:hypothetical protein
LKRLEPNLLLAATTVIALLLVVACAALVAPGLGLKYAALAVISPVAFLLLNSFMLNRRNSKPGGANRKPRILISREAPGTAAWSSIFPMMVMASAVLPLIAPRGDYGLMIIIAGIWTGLTIQSALQARREAAEG